MNPELLRSSWRELVALGDEFPLLFYAVLFDMAPEVAGLFPVSMVEQRKKLLATLGVVVNAPPAEEVTDETTAVVERLQRLGADHRRYGAEPEHYPVVGQALLLTMEHLLSEWTEEHAQTWAGAFGVVADAMSAAAAQQAERGVPAWAELDVVERDGDLEGALIKVEAGVFPGYDWSLGRSYWLSPSIRGSGWSKGHVSDVDLGSGDKPSWVNLYVALTDDDLDSLALDALAPGEQLRLAPVYEEAPSHAE